MTDSTPPRRLDLRIDMNTGGIVGRAVGMRTVAHHQDVLYMPVAEHEAAMASGLPRTGNRTYDLRQRLDCAVRWLREAEDIARIEMPEWPTADRIRSIYEQITADVLEGKTDVPPIMQRLRDAERERDAWWAAATKVRSCCDD